MRILVLTPDFPPAIGGIQLLAAELLAHAAGWEPLVFTLGDPGAAEHDRQLPYPVHRIPRTGGHKAALAALQAHAAASALRRRPDAVLALHLFTFPGALAAARLARAPAVVMLYAKEMGARPKLTRFSVAQADATVAISQYTATRALEAGCPQERLHLVLPGVDARAFPAEAVPPGPPTIVTVARLGDRYKGFDVMLRAMPLIAARVPDARWVVVGDGPLRAELTDITRAWGLAQRVVFTGAVTDEQRDAWLARADVFAMPSRVPLGRTSGEGFGIVYLEAALAGVPSVAGDAGGATDAVLDGETGTLVDASDHVAVADAVADLLLDPERARRLGAAGGARARTLTWQRMADRVQEVVAAEVARRS